MKDSARIWLRWIFLLPGSLISGFLATFPLHWTLYFSLARGETISGVNIEPIERALSPFVIAIMFILVGYKIAPKYKFQACIALTLLWTTFFIGIFIFMSDQQVQLQGRGIGSLLGSFLGLYIAWRKPRTAH